MLRTFLVLFLLASAAVADGPQFLVLRVRTDGAVTGITPSQRNDPAIAGTLRTGETAAVVPWQDITPLRTIPAQEADDATKAMVPILEVVAGRLRGRLAATVRAELQDVRTAAIRVPTPEGIQARDRALILRLLDARALLAAIDGELQETPQDAALLATRPEVLRSRLAIRVERAARQ